MDIAHLVAFLMPLKLRQMEKLGGYTQWEQLSDTEKTVADTAIIRDVGQHVFDALSEKEHNQLTQFIRTGCCMHKDLNTVKGGNRALRDTWAAEDKTEPMLLANKDNAAVLEMCTDPLNPTPAERRAAETSKRGGSHITTLGGMICCNKDKKKGQQNTCNWYMHHHVGHSVPYPDVSNTQYGSHGEAAGVLVVHRDRFLRFMEHIRDVKEKPGFMNIEKNFYLGLQDTPTLTELCTLAAYNVCISRAFMKYVQQHENILDLRDFFTKKINLLDAVMANPKVWTGNNVKHEMAVLGRGEWDKWECRVMKTIQDYATTLPDLDRAIAVFVRGCKLTFTERSSNEFAGDIDCLTDIEWKDHFFASTNDRNEGGLGTWCSAQRLRPAETIHKFNLSFTASQNNTEEFMQCKLNTDEDDQYLRKTAQYLDKSGLQKKAKEDQIKADTEKAAANRQKETQQQQHRENQGAVIAETANHLVLSDDGIDKLTVMDLNKQLDFHREEERKYVKTGGELTKQVPLKTHMGKKLERVAALKKAVSQYLSRGGTTLTNVSPISNQHATEMMAGPGDEFYISDHEDNLT